MSTLERDLQDLSNAAADAAEGDQGLVGRAEQAVEEVVEEAERCIGHYPISSVAAALGGGILIGWLIGRASGRL
jgi:ElaB/YqjD/DUF883 family membrane-anchored ribosome-binding protein